MRFLFFTLTVVFVALASGIGSAYWAVTRGALFNTIDAGPWTAYPNATSVEADPYAQAHQVNRQSLPVTGFDSIAFEADEDSSGAGLDGRCLYRIGGPLPPARFWTLSVIRPGRSDASVRSGLTSVELVRDQDGGFLIELSATVRPGNWLPVTPGPFRLEMNLYDTSIGSGVGIEVVTMPPIERGACT